MFKNSFHLIITLLDNNVIFQILFSLLDFIFKIHFSRCVVRDFLNIRSKISNTGVMLIKKIRRVQGVLLPGRVENFKFSLHPSS